MIVLISWKPEQDAPRVCSFAFSSRPRLGPTELVPLPGGCTLPIAPAGCTPLAERRMGSANAKPAPRWFAPGWLSEAFPDCNMFLHLYSAACRVAAPHLLRGVA